MSNPRHDIAREIIEHAIKHPYDDCQTVSPAAPLGWAHVAAQGVLADLLDRHLFGTGLIGVEMHTRKEIVESLANIVIVSFLEYRGDQRH